MTTTTITYAGLTFDVTPEVAEWVSVRGSKSNRPVFEAMGDEKSTLADPRTESGRKSRSASRIDVAEKMALEQEFRAAKKAAKRSAK